MNETATEPEVGDHVKIQGVIRHIYHGEAAVKVFRPGEGDPGIVWVQCGALEHVEVKEDPDVILSRGECRYADALSRGMVTHCTTPKAWRHTWLGLPGRMSGNR